MEAASLNTLSAYSNTVGDTLRTDQRREVGGAVSEQGRGSSSSGNEVQSSTRVSLSQAAQSRLAQERQAAASQLEASELTPRNAPVEQTEPTPESANEPAAQAAPAATANVVQQVQTSNASLQAGAVASITGGDSSGASGGLTVEPAAAPQADSVPSSTSGPSASISDLATGIGTVSAQPATTPSRVEPSPVDVTEDPGLSAVNNQRAEQTQQQTQAQQSDTAQTRQDVPPSLAQSGVATYQRVLSF